MTFTGEIFLWQSEQSAWHFLRINTDDAELIKHVTGHLPRKGFGSVKVSATIGKTTFTTSIFPEKEGTYLLPLKASVRKAEKLGPNMTATVDIEFPDL